MRYRYTLIIVLLSIICGCNAKDSSKIANPYSFEAVDQVTRYNKHNFKGQKTGVWLTKEGDISLIEFYADGALDYYRFKYNNLGIVSVEKYEDGALTEIVSSYDDTTNGKCTDRTWYKENTDEYLLSVKVYESSLPAVSIYAVKEGDLSVCIFENGLSKEEYHLFSELNPLQSRWSLVIKDIKYNSLPLKSINSIPIYEGLAYEASDDSQLIAEKVLFDDFMVDSYILERFEYNTSGELRIRYSEEETTEPLEYVLDKNNQNFHVHDRLLFNKIDSLGRKHGIWISQQAPDTCVIESFSDGLLDSYRYVFKGDDVVQVELYDNGILHSVIKSQNIFDEEGKKDGLWVEKEGEFLSVRSYSHGIFHGPFVYLTCASPTLIGCFDMGNPCGEWVGTTSVWKGAGAPVWGFRCEDFRVSDNDDYPFLCTYYLCSANSINDRYSTGTLQLSREIISEGSGYLFYDKYPVVGDTSYSKRIH